MLPNRSALSHTFTSQQIARLPLTGHVFGGPIRSFDTRSGACQVPGPPLSEILPGIRGPTLSMFKKTAQHPVKELSDSHQTLEGAVRAGRAHR